MTRWSELHAYNALVAAELTEAVDPDRLRTAASAAVEELGIGGAPPVARAAGSLDAHAAEELNTPFAASAPPFRLTALSGGARPHVILAWDHWAADGLSGDWLLHRVLTGAFALPPAAAPSLARAGPPPPRLAVPRPSALAGSVADLLRMRRAFSPCAGDRDDLRVSARTVELPAGALATLLDAARARGVTLHDLLLAALAEALAAALPQRSRQRRRRELAIATVADLRSRFPGRYAEAFGNALGQFPVFVAPDQTPTFEAMLAAVAAQTRLRKSPRGLAQGLLELRAAALAWPLVKRAEKARWYRRQWVLAGGLSNLRLPDAWLAPLSSRVARYVRFAPAGPLVPLALAASTAGGDLTLTASWQRTAFAPAELELLLTTLRARLGAGAAGTAS